MKTLILTILMYTVAISKPDIVTATVYHAVPSQTNSDPEHTASMFELDLKNPYKHRIIAVSRDLTKKYPMGTKVRIQGTGYYDGIYQVQDLMNKRWTGRIDILINQDMKLGKWKNVKLTKIKS
jgi:3D (Asp-Asp-Asp) domain-containing protein